MLRSAPMGRQLPPGCRHAWVVPRLEGGHTAQRSTTIYNLTIMAKGIDINGQLRGKRGGVVYYRANGQQISRARNFSPKNPKTNAQMIQRAVTATVMMMYSAGKEIFDHSFEGKSVPGGSQRAFMSENMRMLRKGITADLKAIENGTYEDEEALAAASPYRVVSPRSYGPTAAPYIISKGTYKNTALKTTLTDESCKLDFGIAPVADETVATWLGRSNIAAGDIFTIVFLSGTMAGSSRVSSPELNFNVIRLVAKAPTTDVIVGKKVSDLFEVTAKGADVAFDLSNIANHAFAAGNNTVTLEGNTTGSANYGIWALGRIVSRDDSGVRSNSVMQVLHGADIEPNISVTAASLVESWQRAVEPTDSSLILEGGNF